MSNHERMITLYNLIAEYNLPLQQIQLNLDIQKELANNEMQQAWRDGDKETISRITAERSQISAIRAQVDALCIEFDGE